MEVGREGWAASELYCFFRVGFFLRFLCFFLRASFCFLFFSFFFVFFFFFSRFCFFCFFCFLLGKARHAKAGGGGGCQATNEGTPGGYFLLNGGAAAAIGGIGSTSTGACVVQKRAQKRVS